MTPATQPDADGHRYNLGGLTCLAGDFLPDYIFPQPLNAGDRIVFEDMMHYTMVKTTTFNGVTLPAIAIARENGSMDVIKTFRLRRLQTSDLKRILGGHSR